MERIKVVLAPTQHFTQILAMQGPHEILRARLGPPSLVHRMAAPLLLEGLSLWYQSPLSVVLCVGSAADSSPLTRSLSDPGGLGAHTLCYAVDLSTPGRRRGRMLGGPGDFRALSSLCRSQDAGAFDPGELP